MVLLIGFYSLNNDISQFIYIKNNMNQFFLQKYNNLNRICIHERILRSVYFETIDSNLIDPKR